MKKLFLLLSFMAGLVCFQACSTDVMLYADYKEIPVIYALIDASQDTNFVRINRAFSSSNESPIDATQVALIEDSCNYPGKLDAQIIEYKGSAFGSNFTPTGRVIQLDTMTILDKEPGVFYSPRQKVYYTDEVFNSNNASEKYRYKLVVQIGKETVTSETGIVGGDDFEILTTSIGSTNVPSNVFKKIKFRLADNALFYEVKMVFNYEESINGGPMVKRQIVQSFGAKSVDELTIENNTTYVEYSMNALFKNLTDAIAGDTVINPDHPNIIRKCDNKPMEIFISAGGDELYNYIQVNSVTSYSQTVPDYTNVSGGYGVFSSRVNLSKVVSLDAATMRELYGSTAWGFVTQ